MELVLGNRYVVVESLDLESSPRAVSGGPVARSPVRGPGRAGRKYSGCGRARAARNKARTGYGRPWVKILAREAKKYKILLKF